MRQQTKKNRHERGDSKGNTQYFQIQFPREKLNKKNHFIYDNSNYLDLVIINLQSQGQASFE